MEGGKIKIKVESATSEFYLECKETDKVKDLMKIVKDAWGDEDKPNLIHQSMVMDQSDYKLSAYNVKDGSVVKVTY